MSSLKEINAETAVFQMGPCPLLWPLCMCGVVTDWEWWKTTRISMLFPISFLSYLRSVCVSASFNPHSFSLVVRVWSGDSQSPSFLSPASPSGPVRNSLVILGFCRFVVEPQFKTTSLFFIQVFTRMFSEPHPHQTALSEFPLCAQHAIIAALTEKFLAVKAYIPVYKQNVPF